MTRKKTAGAALVPIADTPDALMVEWWAIDRVREYAKNPRVNEGSVRLVAESLTQFGWRQPIVVDAQGVIIAGHTRIKAARSLSMEKVPVHVATELSPRQIKAYRLADNRTAEEATWDVPLLAEELRELHTDSYDDLAALTAFSIDEIERFIGREDGSSSAGGTRPDVPLELGLYVTCTSEEQQRHLFERLSAEGFACKTTLG